MRHVIDHAKALWHDLAAFAWGYYRSMGRGVLVMNAAELHAAAAAPPGDRMQMLRPSFVPLSMIPQGDDYRGTIAAYDPQQEILLLVSTDEPEPLFFAVAADGSGRPAPPECFEAWRRAADATAAGSMERQDASSPPRDAPDSRGFA